MAKVDLGLVSQVLYAGGELTSSTLDLGAKPTGTKVFTPIYPRFGHIGEEIDISVTVTENSSGHLIVSSDAYRGTVVIACYVTV